MVKNARSARLIRAEWVLGSRPEGSKTTRGRAWLAWRKRLLSTWWFPPLPCGCEFVVTVRRHLPDTSSDPPGVVARRVFMWSLRGWMSRLARVWCVARSRHEGRRRWCRRGAARAAPLRDRDRAKFLFRATAATDWRSWRLRPFCRLRAGAGRGCGCLPGPQRRAVRGATDR